MRVCYVFEWEGGSWSYTDAPVTTVPFALEIEKGKRKVYYLLDDYFMMLAVLAKSRSPFKDEKVAA